MKAIIFSLLLILVCQVCFAQLKLPSLSPEGSILQQVGYTNIHVRYGRPAARERKIMGGLVEFGSLWRTGAGPCTTISFDTEVEIAGKKIPAGIYALLTIPDENQWTVLLNRDTSKLYGAAYEYDVKDEALRFETKPFGTQQPVESFSISIDIRDNNALLMMAWENTAIRFEINTLANEKAKQHISEMIQISPTDDEMLAYASCYYLMMNREHADALRMANKALEIKEEWWYYENKMQILAAMKRYPEAWHTYDTGVRFISRTKPDQWEELIRVMKRETEGWPARDK